MATRARAGATIEDLYHVEGKAEIIAGELVLMGASGDMPSRASLRIARSLDDYAVATGRGRAYGDNAGFIVHLPRRDSFSPDAAFYTGNPTGMKFLEGAPAFAAEIRSEN